MRFLSRCNRCFLINNTTIFNIAVHNFRCYSNIIFDVTVHIFFYVTGYVFSTLQYMFFSILQYFFPMSRRQCSDASADQVGLPAAASPKLGAQWASAIAITGRGVRVRVLGAAPCARDDVYVVLAGQLAKCRSAPSRWLPASAALVQFGVEDSCSK
jgi:hypothetical protein